MERYTLSPGYRKILGLCYKATFFLMAAYLIFFLAIVFFVIQGWIEQENKILEIGAYFIGSLMAICILTMANYAVGYIWHLWKNGLRKYALQGLATFVFLNILTGYIWFYWSEVKHQEIRFIIGVMGLRVK